MQNYVVYVLLGQRNAKAKCPVLHPLMLSPLPTLDVVVFISLFHVSVGMSTTVVYETTANEPIGFASLRPACCVWAQTILDGYSGIEPAFSVIVV